MQLFIVYFQTITWSLLLGGVVADDDIGVRRHRAIAANGKADEITTVEMDMLKLEPAVRHTRKQQTDQHAAISVGSSSLLSATDISSVTNSSDAEASNAIFGVLANYGWNQFTSDDESFNSAATLICSARFKGSKVPFHLIYGGGEPEAHLSVLRTLGWTVDDHTSDLQFWKSNYKPIYNSSSAKEKGRRWVENNRVQHRGDGWLTYLKFHAWQATSYDHVMLVDMDVQFLANPDRGFSNVSKEVDFLTSFEKTPSEQYGGLNTHIALLKPSLSTFQELVRKARDGDYVPRTNTEQDIIEDFYPPEKGVTTDMRRLFPHVHRDYSVLRRKCVKDWTDKLLRVASPSCMDLKIKCKGNIFG